MNVYFLFVNKLAILSISIFCVLFGHKASEGSACLVPSHHTLFITRGYVLILITLVE